MEKEQLEQRKKMLTELMNDKAYVPMKAKELAMLLDIPKSRREELQEVLDKLVEDGVIGVSKKGKYARSETFSVNGLLAAIPEDSDLLQLRGMERDCIYSRGQDRGCPAWRSGADRDHMPMDRKDAVRKGQ